MSVCSSCLGYESVPGCRSISVRANRAEGDFDMAWHSTGMFGAWLLSGWLHRGVLYAQPSLVYATSKLGHGRDV
jgi:hypothetical protein